MGSMVDRAQIAVRGVVQGVGFRPYVHALAAGLGLMGYVTNTADGVLIDVEGEHVTEFLSRLQPEAPPLSRITTISITRLPVQGYREFTIRTSTDSCRDFTLVSPDAATCPDCLRELLDPTNRRFRYPFINCTNCGPRYSITRHVPYDRPNTTMATFMMCPQCAREYHDPADRRFHAQPNACPQCGPQIEFRTRAIQESVKGYEALAQCIRTLQEGRIVAIKGLGGFHLACNAADDGAVRTLRERKRRSNKPFAVMFPAMEMLRRFCTVDNAEERLLESIARPIVLLGKKSDGDRLSGAVSPNNRYMGCMLPYTPIHHLLFNGAAEPSGKDATFEALVMTSGNLSEEPIVYENDAALEKLSGIVDAVLLHDRDIFMRVDDSVLRATGNERPGTASSDQGTEDSSSSRSARALPVMFLRRSRGFAPDPIQLDSDGPDVLGCGADLKNTFTLTRGSFAIPSQHIGDMENYETLAFYEECLANLKQVYRAEPAAIAHDLHPGYVSTRWAREHGSRNRLGCHAIQHHYAHIGSVMAEHGLRGPVLGVAFDGTGYGTDGNLWGGEFLVARIDGFDRVGQFRYLPLPGGESAIREPWRTAISAVLQSAPDSALDHLKNIGFIERYGHRGVEQVIRVAALRDVSPLSSGAGRLFDAVSAIMGICDRNTFEGEAAMALESLVVDGIEGDYAVEMRRENGYTSLDFSPLVLSIIDAVTCGVDHSVIATKFHNTIAKIIVTMATSVLMDRDLRDVALSGGTFQNLFLLRKAVRMLTAQGLRVFHNRQMPPNDACISLGQAYLVRERLKRGSGA